MLNPNINSVILSRVFNYLREGKVRECLALGFSEEEIKELSQLSIDELYDIASSSSSVFKTEVNHQVFWRLLALARDNSKNRRIVDRALMLGASIQMLNEYFGMTTSEVSGRRHLLGIEEPMGRKKAATDEEQALIWEKWKLQEHKIDNLATIEALEILIWISEETSINLTEIWKLVSSWRQRNTQ